MIGQPKMVLDKSEPKGGVAGGMNVTYYSADQSANCRTRSNYGLGAPWNTGWCAERRLAGQWIQIDAGREVLWKKIATKGVGRQYITRYFLQSTTDYRKWTASASLDGNTNPAQVKETYP